MEQEVQPSTKPVRRSVDFTPEQLELVRKYQAKILDQFGLEVADAQVFRKIVELGCDALKEILSRQ